MASFGDLRRRLRIRMSLFLILFTAAPVLPLAAEPLYEAPSLYRERWTQDVATADFNGDGILDIAYHGVNVLLGRGDGLFDHGSGYFYLHFGKAMALEVGDFDLDGIADLAVSNATCSGGEVSLLRGLGDGGFTRVFSAHLSSKWCGHVKAGDLDEDGVLDLVVANPYGSRVHIFIGDGDGRFRYGTDIITSLAPWSLVIEDFNADSHLDVAAGNLYTLSTSILTGNGDGTFRPERFYFAGGVPWSLGSADFDRDGDIDLIAGDPWPSALSVMHNRGCGTFGWSGFQGDPIFPTDLVTTDFNADGLVDVVAADFMEGWDSRTTPPDSGVSIFLGDGCGHFARQPALPYPSFAVETADLDCNGREDIISAYDGLRVHLARSDGSFPLPDVVSLGGAVEDLHLADIDGDGLVDGVAVVEDRVQSIMELVVLGGTGTGSFSETGACEVSGDTVSLCVHDLDRDGSPDVVLGEDGGETLEVLLNDGHGAFQEAGRFPAGGPADEIAAGDLNSDGVTDLTVLSFYKHTISTLLGTGAGALAPPWTIIIDHAPRSPALADVDGDGFLDLAVGISTLSGGVHLLRGEGDGTLLPHTTLETGESTHSLVFTDLDKNGIQDLVVSQQYDGVGVFVGLGEGEFLPIRLYPGSSWVQSVVPAEVTRDGKPDLLAAYANGFGVFLGDWGGALQWHSNYAATIEIDTIRTADLDRDGRDDVVAFEKGKSEALNILMGEPPGGICFVGFVMDGVHAE